MMFESTKGRVVTIGQRHLAGSSRIARQLDVSLNRLNAMGIVVSAKPSEQG